MDNTDKAFEPIGENVRFTTAEVDGKEVEVVEIDRGPGNTVSFPVDEEAEKDEDGKIITYGEKYKDFRDNKSKPVKERSGPSPQAHLYPDKKAAKKK